MSKKHKNAEQNYRARLRYEQQVAAKKKKRNKIFMVIVGLVVIALATMGVVARQWGSTPPDDTPDFSDAFIPPGGTSEMMFIEVKNPNVKPDAIIFDEHLDYQCGHCHEAYSLFGDTVHALADRGDIILRVHVRSFMDVNLHNTASRRASMGSTCADTVGKFEKYHRLVFDTPPLDEKDLWTDEQLRESIPSAAGITGDELDSFQVCYDTQKTLRYIEAMEYYNAPSGGTPNFYVNGIQVTLGDLVGTTEIDGEQYLVPIVDVDPDGFLEFLTGVVQNPPEATDDQSTEPAR
ncbi:MAG: DsbA family protein [Propionibacteriaceae bacterium]|nr:DsbA family protein [Propionibacteriaceae bacterium]